MNVVNKFKFIVVSLLVIIFIALYVYKTNKIYGGDIDNIEKSKIVTLSTNNYKIALKNYETRIGFCKSQEKKNIITDKNKKILNSISITKKQLKKSIYILNIRAYNRCVSEQFGLFLMARGKYSETLKYYKIPFDENITYYDDSMLFVLPHNHFKLELDYAAIPKSKRDQIESIEQLKRPFFPLDIVNK